MDSKGIGVVVVGAGLLLVVVGALVYTGALSWFGRLPGDVRIEREGLSVYVPLTSMLLVSVGLSALLYLIRKFFG
jgi:hypothetical protein